MSKIPREHEAINSPIDVDTYPKPNTDKARRKRIIGLFAVFATLALGLEAHDPQTIPRGIKSIKDHTMSLPNFGEPETANQRADLPENPKNDLPSLDGLDVYKVSPLEVEFTKGVTFRYSPVKKDGPDGNLGLTAEESFRIPVTAPVTVIRKYGEDDGWVGVETEDVMGSISQVMGSDPETRDSFASSKTLRGLFEVAAKDNSGVIWFSTEDSTPLYGGDSMPPDQFDIPPYGTPEEPQSYSIVFSIT